jgi:hypothetical protein
MVRVVFDSEQILAANSKPVISARWLLKFNGDGRPGASEPVQTVDSPARSCEDA